MIGVAVSSFWMVEIRRGAGPSWIHLLWAWTMVGTLLGLVGAGLGAFAPGRALSPF